MARTAIPLTSVPFQSNIATVSWTAADAVNKMTVPNDGKTILLVKNAGGSDITVTVTAVADEAGRAVNLTITCPATTGISVIGPLRQKWWNQSNGQVYFEVSSATSVTVAALKLND